uniref:Uncharacterized protein n=1 Tax=Oryza brachyantha TaxID=4533 RepID=J3MWS9_ORYBR
MEGSDSSHARVSMEATIPGLVPAPTHQARRMLSDLFPAHGTTPPQHHLQSSSAQRRVMSMAPTLQRWRVNGGTAVESLPLNQVRSNGLVISTFLVTIVRHQQRLRYSNTGTIPLVTPTSAPPTTQLPMVQNTMVGTMSPVTSQRTIDHRTLNDIISPVAVHGNGNPLACIFCARGFALRSSEILRLLPPRVFSYPEPIRPPPLPVMLPLAPVGHTSLTTGMCSDPHHFFLTMQHMPRQVLANLNWTSQIGNIHNVVPTHIGGQHVGMALSSAGFTGINVLPTLNLTHMPVIHREQPAPPLIMSSSSTSLEDISSAIMPPMLNMMRMQAIGREQHVPPSTTPSLSSSGLHCDYVTPEHEDMVCLTLGRSCTMDLHLGL